MGEWEYGGGQPIEERHFGSSWLDEIVGNFQKGFYNPRVLRTQEKGDSCSNSSIEKVPKTSYALLHSNTSPTVCAKGHSLLQTIH
mmetsp:Transcript_66760/g.178493  ORF Transcript_66760/g.178493 Transcript_66760/m.178493 type:complete len:85 (-) Transcript_66760:61-315(-)